MMYLVITHRFAFDIACRYRAYLVAAYTVMAYIVMAEIVMARRFVFDIACLALSDINQCPSRVGHGLSVLELPQQPCDLGSKSVILGVLPCHIPVAILRRLLSNRPWR